jgi:hypothetical protein
VITDHLLSVVTQVVTLKHLLYNNVYKQQLSNQGAYFLYSQRDYFVQDYLFIKKADVKLIQKLKAKDLRKEEL